MSEPTNPNNYPSDSFGNNPPTHPGANAPFYGQETEPAPVKKNRTGLIAGAAIAGLLVLGGSAYAVTSVINAAGDKDISKVIPGNSAVFVQVDLNPSNSQKAAALTLASKIDDLVDEDDEYDTGSKDFKEIATDPAFEDLDYETEVKPWIGDKVAIAAWGDFSGAYGGGYADDYSDDYAQQDYYSDAPSSNPAYDSGYDADPYADVYDDDYLDGKYDNLDQIDKDGKGVQVITPNINTVSHGNEEEGASLPEQENKPSLVLVYEAKNKDKAEQAAQKIIERNDEIGAYTVRDGYLILAENDEIISEYIDSLEKSNLSANETYVSDMKVLGGDNIASAWLDFSKMGVDGYLQDIGFSEDGEELQGRVATGVSLTGDGVTSQTKVIGLSGYSTITDKVASSSEGIKGIGNFSKDSAMVYSVSGLPEYAKAALEEYKKQSPEGVESFLASAREAGFNFPDDFQKIFGSETGLAFTSPKADEGASYEYRATGAEVEKIEALIAQTGSEGLGFEVTTEGDTTVLKFDTNGTSSDEKLSSHEKFNAVLRDLDKANGALFINVDAIEEAENTEGATEDDKDYGVIGATTSHDSEKNISDLTARWIF